MDNLILKINNLFKLRHLLQYIYGDSLYTNYLLTHVYRFVNVFSLHLFILIIEPVEFHEVQYIN